MAGISSRIGTFAIGKQTQKGLPAAGPTIKLLMNGAPSLAPSKERARLSMTDAGRDQGRAFTQLVSVSGDVPVYLHPEAISLLNYLVLGGNADAGGPENFTHTATPADDLPWFTCWRMVGNVIFEKFVDCKLNALNIEGSAGQPLSATLSIIGCKSVLEEEDTELTPIDSDPYFFPDIKGRFKVDSTPRQIHQLTFGIDNGLSGYQADDYVYEDVDPGGRTVTLSFSTRFRGLEAWPDYKEFFYGDGTDLVGEVASHAFEFEFAKDENTSVKYQLPQVVYTAIPVNPDPGGAPLEVQVPCEVEKPAGQHIVTATTKDQIESL